MRLAVFTSQYPARTATFFERDMRALLESGVEIEVFPIYPLNADLWRYSLDLLGPDRLPHHRVHHLRVSESTRPAGATLRSRAWTCLADAGAVLWSAARFGPGAFAKTAYVLPKSWAWAAEHAGRFDHVLGYWGNYAGTCAYAFHRLLDRSVPFSIWLHAGVDLYRTPVYLREKLRYADNIITCCEFNRDFIAQRFPDLEPRLRSRIHVCHHGLDLEDFPYRPANRPPGRVIVVGRLAEHKGFDYLLRAARIVRSERPDLEVEVIGDGPDRARLQSLASELGMADRVRFRGWLPFPKARRAMAEATLLVHPSDGLGDGLPNVIREAMALGTPVIGSDVAGIPDALGDGCGYLVPPRDVGALAHAIRDVLNNPATRSSIAERARRKVEERYDLWKNGARLAALLRATRRQIAHMPARAGDVILQENA